MSGQQVVTLVTNLLLFVFIVASMLSIGLSLTLKQIISQLRNGRLVGLAIVINFLLIPALAYGLAYAFRLDQPLKTGFILVGVAAGAPFLPKLSQLARGSIAFSAGLMTALMIVTIIYIPLILPLMLQGVTVDAWSLAKPLLIVMLLPLAIGLLIHSRWPQIARYLVPTLGRISTFAGLLGIGFILLTNITDLVSLFGTYSIAGAIILTVISFGFGFWAGGPDLGTRKVLGLGTAFRNLGAAFAIFAANFSDQPTVGLVIVVFALVAFIILGIIAGEFGRRTKNKLSLEEPMRERQTAVTNDVTKPPSSPKPPIFPGVSGR